MKEEDTTLYEKLHPQIVEIYTEMSILSKKSPDGPINKFKLKLVNQLLTNSNSILNATNCPFDEFIVFDEDSVPTNSDVVVILSQYIKCLDKFKCDNATYLSGIWYWKIDNKQSSLKTTRPIF